MQALKPRRPYLLAKHWKQLLLDSGYRARSMQSRREFLAFKHQSGGAGLASKVTPGSSTLRKALIVSQYYLPFTKLEAVLLKGLQMGGFETVILGNRSIDFMRYGWLAGNTIVHDFIDFVDRHGDNDWADEKVESLRNQDELMALEYNGVHVGRFTVASALRHLRAGELDFADPAVKKEIRWLLRNSVRFAIGAVRAIESLKPDLVLVMDRGYSGYGEVFDAAIQRGIDAVTWNMAYKSNRLALKRYSIANERDHPLAPSYDTWETMKSVEWKPEYGDAVRRELFECYESQDWFSVVGTQFDKSMRSASETRDLLGVGDGRKLAVIFPHILWDGSFFWGTDLFRDYTEWLVETVRAAVANPAVDWVIKLHPAHLVKAKQINDMNRPAELDVLEGRVGPLPAHVKLVYPDTDLSTYSLFQVADYAVTVRGTVGFEASVFGVPVFTAGTGRYDRRGFTIDSASTTEYLDRLANIQTYGRLEASQVQLAERYAYMVFFCRLLRMQAASVAFARDDIATPNVTIHSRTPKEWYASPEMQELSRWFADGKREDMFSMREV